MPFLGLAGRSGMDCSSWMASSWKTSWLQQGALPTFRACHSPSGPSWRAFTLSEVSTSMMWKIFFRTSGESTGQATSTRRSVFRVIKSAEEMYRAASSPRPKR